MTVVLRHGKTGGEPLVFRTFTDLEAHLVVGDVCKATYRNAVLTWAVTDTPLPLVLMNGLHNDRTDKWEKV